MTTIRRVIIVVRAYPPDVSASGSLVRHVATSFADHLPTVVVATSGTATDPGRDTVAGVKVVRMARPPASGAGPRGQARVLISRLRRLLGSPVAASSVRDLDRVFSELGVGVDDLVIPVTASEMLACAHLQPPRRFVLAPWFLEVFPPPPASTRLPRPARRWAERGRSSAHARAVAHAEVAFSLPGPLDRITTDAGPTTHVVRLEHPMIRDLSVSHAPPRDRLVLVYAGGLDLRQRHPGFMLDVLSAASGSRPLDVHVYSYGNCEDVLKSGRWPLVHPHGQVSPDVAVDAMRQADVLLTQGNTSSELSPSKIYDCMSTGLPIIHFHSTDDDGYLPILRAYELAICVRIGSDMTNAADKVRSFLLASAGQRVPFEHVTRTFADCTPESVVAKLLAALAAKGVL